MKLKKTVPYFIFAVLLLLFAAVNILRAQEKMLGDLSDGNRSVPVHLIKLIDEDSSVVRPDEKPLLPFSTKYTCGKCHNYEVIGEGWHFNASDSAVQEGRRGLPWILVDRVSATLLPISLRPWQGVFTPAETGMSTLDFISRFGRHMPGGGIGEEEDAQQLQNLFRWRVSGKLEINCLSCHDNEFGHDQAAYATQIQKQNFRWAAAASSGFAQVQGSAKDMPNNYDIYFGVAPDNPQKIPPQVRYDESRFNRKNEIYFDIVREGPDRNCYYCHTTKTIDANRPERWQHEEDIHLAAGMQCVDCHRNGLDHAIVRGYEDKAALTHNPHAAAFSCRGCHLGIEGSSVTLVGKLGAPFPLHKGLPPLHFEKLACTACHSGSLPGQELLRVKTSTAHALGVHGTNKSDLALPHILSPVFVRDQNKITPHNLIWPAFWAELQGDSVVPILPELIKPIAGKFIPHVDTLRTGDWNPISVSILERILDSIAVSRIIQGTPAYLTAGKVFLKDSLGVLVSQSHRNASPYTWAIAHAVRPASQSLGIGGCTDCHSINSAFYYAEVLVDSPLDTLHSAEKMTTYMESNLFSVSIFSFSFLFRPWLKLLIIFCCIILISVLLLYALNGISTIIRELSAEEKRT